MKPTSFTLLVKRNLSYSWYKDQPQIDLSGRLKSIELNVISHDYKTIMQILEKNMTEGTNEFKRPKKPKSFNFPEHVIGNKIHYFLFNNIMWNGLKEKHYSIMSNIVLLIVFTNFL
jgi:hypothetical protein